MRNSEISNSLPQTKMNNKTSSLWKSLPTNWQDLCRTDGRNPHKTTTNSKQNTYLKDLINTFDLEIQ
jgi:hypothetical protein